MCLIASSSGSTQSCQPFEPYDIQPRMIFETLRPEFPRRTVNKIDIESKRTVVHKEEMAEALTVLHLVHNGRHRSTRGDMVVESSREGTGRLRRQDNACCWLTTVSRCANIYDLWVLRTSSGCLPFPCYSLPRARREDAPPGINYVRDELVRSQRQFTDIERLLALRQHCQWLVLWALWTSDS